MFHCAAMTCSNLAPVNGRRALLRDTEFVCRDAGLKGYRPAAPATDPASRAPSQASVAGSGRECCNLIHIPIAHRSSFLCKVFTFCPHLAAMACTASALRVPMAFKSQQQAPQQRRLVVASAARTEAEPSRRSLLAAGLALLAGVQQAQQAQGDAQQECGRSVCCSLCRHLLAPPPAILTFVAGGLYAAAAPGRWDGESSAIGSCPLGDEGIECRQAILL